MPPSTPSGSQNQFFGQKVSKPGVDVNTASDDQLIYKNDFNTTTYYDQSGNIALELGQLGSGLYGLSGNNSNIVLSSGVGQQITIGNSNNSNIVLSNKGVEQIIIGLLPDGTYGLVISKPGIDVRTVFS